MHDLPGLIGAAPTCVRAGEARGPARLFDRRPVAINERIRCYRYEPGQRFAPHYDGAFRRSDFEASELTFMVYLNDGFVGGTTRFHDFDIDVVPRTGSALLFQHRLLHALSAPQRSFDLTQLYPYSVTAPGLLASSRETLYVATELNKYYLIKKSEKRNRPQGLCGELINGDGWPACGRWSDHA